MRTHTTTTLKDLIKVQMNPENQMTAQEIDTWNLALPEIEEELLKHIKFFAYSLFSVSLAKRQLQQMQAECTSLLNFIDKYDSFDGELLILKTNAVKCLCSVLNTLMDEYESYVDLTVNMSRIQYREIVNTLCNSVIAIKKRFIFHEINSDLQTILLESFEKLIGMKTASYQSINYVMNYLPELNRILSYSPYEGLEGDIAQYLNRNHYNSDKFIEYLIKQYEIKLNQIVNLNDRQTYLIRTEFNLRKRTATVKKPKYIRDGPNIHDHLIRFFNTELACLKIAIEKAKPKVVPIKAPVAVPLCAVDYKLRFTFSVESLAYLIKLMVNANIIEPGIKAELLRHIAANFQTPGTKVGGISEGSFTTKYKNVTHSTSVTVKAGLMAMLKLIEKEF